MAASAKAKTVTRLPKGMRVTSLIDGKPMYKHFTSRTGRVMGSPRGADLRWSLPTTTKPGKWMVERGRPVLCSRGLHIFFGPRYLGERISGRIFRVEVAGQIARSAHGCYPDASKLCAEACRLLYEIKPGDAEWRALAHACHGGPYTPITALRGGLTAVGTMSVKLLKATISTLETKLRAAEAAQVKAEDALAAVRNAVRQAVG